MITKQIMDDYTTYIDNAEMIMEYYKNKKTSGLEKYFLKIEEWLKKDIPSEENKPLVIEADEGVGKKTLINQWMQYHQQNSRKSCSDIIIPHFAGSGGNNSNYYYAIYKILVKLRDAFNISQKVELLEDKLRRYFHYWLDVCSRTLSNQIVNDSTIILIFEGINLFTDYESGQEANVSLWLPRTFPQKIRVIVTASPGSVAMKHFEKIECPIVLIQSESFIPTTIIDQHASRPSFIVRKEGIAKKLSKNNDDQYKGKVIEILKNKSPEVLKNFLYIKTYLGTLLPYPSDGIIAENEIDKDKFTAIYKSIPYDELEKIDNVNDLNEFVVEFYSQNLVDEVKFKRTLQCLTITDKGLTVTEILQYTALTMQEWNFVLAIFRTYLMKYKGLYKINNESFKKTINQKYPHNHKDQMKMHEDLAEVLNKTPNSVRKLEEQTYHLFISRSYFKLKEQISTIENFLLLFNPNNKYDLCRYWQILEQQGFDPTSEYNKAIEGFELHYKPNAEDIFMIILQISRFLKEFSDFETNFTPEFRHPPIRGGQELKEIGLRHEIKKMGIYMNENWEKEDDEEDEKEELELELVKEIPNQQSLKELVNEIHSQTKKRKNQEALKDQKAKAAAAEKEKKKDEQVPVQVDPEAEKMEQLRLEAIQRFEEFLGRQKTIKEADRILKEVEGLNIDIPENREKFRSFFGGLTKDQRDHNNNKNKQNDNQRYMDLESGEDAPNEDNSINAELPHALELHLNEEDHHHPTKKSKEYKEIDPTFYYYKRWIWLMFPWICLSFKNNYSKIINECFSSATKYMTVEDERKKTKQALRIALEAKLKKQMVYSKDNNLLEQHMKPKLSRTRNSQASLSQSQIGGSLTPKAGKNMLLDQSKLKPKLDSLEPVDQSVLNKAQTAKEKKKGFFVTQDFLNPTVLNQSLSLSKIETKQIDPGVMSPPMTDETMNFSLLNKSKTFREVKDNNYIGTERRVESMLKNANDLTQSIALPTYQDSLLTYGHKQINELEGRVTTMRTNCDEISYSNKNLAKKLKDMKILEYNLEKSGANTFVNKSEQRKIQLEEQVQKGMQMRRDANEQTDRLTKILNICQKNKKSDQLWIKNLNKFVGSINKLMDSEKEIINRNKLDIDQLQKLTNDFINEFQNKKEGQYEIMTRMKNQRNNKDYMDSRVAYAYKDMENSAIYKAQNLNRTHEMMQNQQSNNLNQSGAFGKPEKKIAERKEELESKFIRIKEVIGIDNLEGETFEKYLLGISTLRDLESVTFTKKDEIAKIKEQIEYKKSHLETLKKASKTEYKEKEDVPSAYDDMDDREELKEILRSKLHDTEQTKVRSKRLDGLILDVKMLYADICKKIGINFDIEGLDPKDLPEKDVIEIMSDKLSKVKDQMPEDEFQQFQTGKMDVNARVKYSFKPDLQIRQTSSFHSEDSYTANSPTNNNPTNQFYIKGGKYVEKDRRIK